VTYRIEQPVEKICQECLRRENLLQDENRQLVRAYEGNRKLSEQLRSSVILNRQYQEENEKLKQHLTKMNILLQESQMNFDLLKRNRVKQEFEDEQIKRLRHEIQVYNQFILTKRKEEQKYFSQ
jgi:hypothetical protein